MSGERRRPAMVPEWNPLKAQPTAVDLRVESTWASMEFTVGIATPSPKPTRHRNARARPITG